MGVYHWGTLLSVRNTRKYMSLMEKLKKAGTIKAADVLSDSVFYKDRDSTTTDLPILNIAFSGELNGGFSSGITVVSGPSKVFKCVGPNQRLIVYEVD